MKRRNSQPKICSKENAKQALLCSWYQERKLLPGFSGNGNYQIKASKARYPKNLYLPLSVLFPIPFLDGMITPLILRHHLWHKVMQYFKKEGKFEAPKFSSLQLSLLPRRKKKSCLTFQPHDIPLSLLPLH